MVAVYRVGLKTKPHLKKLRLADFFIMGQWSAQFRFTCVLGGGQTPQDGLQGWMEYATPALQVVIVPYQLGEHKELGTV